MVMSQKQLYNYYLQTAVENIRYSVFYADQLSDSAAQVIDTSFDEFKNFASSLGEPFHGSAEASEVVLDAAASVIMGATWDEWKRAVAHEAGKQGLRGEALVLVSVMHTQDDVHKWYEDHQEDFANGYYNLSSLVPEVLSRIESLRNEAAARDAGYILSSVED